MDVQHRDPTGTGEWLYSRAQNGPFYPLDLKINKVLAEQMDPTSLLKAYISPCLPQREAFKIERAP